MAALWQQALVRPESDLQRLAAESVARARELGLEGFDGSVPTLRQILADKTTHPAARYAAAHALVALNDRDAAPALFEASRNEGSELRQLVEPVLAAWNFEPMHPVWLDRLADPHTHRRELVLACNGLARTRNERGVPALTSIALSPFRPADLRLVAARAAGEISASGLEQHARTLQIGASGQATVIERLCAVGLLTRHQSEEAQRQLAELGRDPEPAVAAAALNVLFSIDPAHVLPLAERSLQSPDPKLRQCGVDAYAAVPTPDRMVRLADVLDDPHITLRSNAREALFRLAGRAELDAAIRGSAFDVLGRDGWRGQEQACLLLGALDYEPAAARLVELLEAERPEVMYTAAWALRMLAVRETLPALFEQAQRQTTARLNNADRRGLDEQVAFLFEAMGRMEFREAEPLMRQYVPKNFALGDHSRCAAIWALGLLHAGQPDEELAVQLVERLRDAASIPSELFSVRQVCAVTLGRMGAVSALPAIREFVVPTSADPLALRARWAVITLTGEDIPVPSVIVKYKTGWFLEPLSDAN
jgi:HEAT repeat protein